MRTNLHHPFLPTVSFFCASLVLPASAAVVDDPDLYSVFDPSGGRSITNTASGATSASTLEALGDFGIIYEYGSFNQGTNIIAFSDETRSDLQISFSGAVSTSSSGAGASLSNNSYSTSPTSAIRFADNAETAAHILSTTLDLGSWDGSTFDGSVGGTSAFGFTLSAPDGAFSRLNSITVQFLDASSQTLSTQTISGVNSGSVGFYFGYQSNAADISSVTVDVSINEGSGSFLMGMDDIGFSSIPETSTYSLITGALGIGLVLFIRRRS
ncbi:hypothetical protein [Puniceicoccus vermicola]|uniref:PEP-CTERM sorting domain-containing protein n=1 Tax=Puniceicoccus vermicola TaxID=388746 RepID=A0A7X1E2T1_9BACT|nr:hypothetical protein [Puniceicoccus vermicola]MBC2600198.1 hypothetical protein [Puniceicoccus vermicola]